MSGTKVDILRHIHWAFGEGKSRDDLQNLFYCNAHMRAVTVLDLESAMFDCERIGGERGAEAGQ